jgi:hypothetical protein
MKRLFRVILIILVLVLLTLQYSHADLLYSKPAFKGRVIDAETKQPIIEAVVVVLYHRWAVIGGPGGPSSSIFKAKETLTDSKGEFLLPSVSSLCPPSLDAGVSFIFYKPGYMAITERGYDTGVDRIRVSLEKYFSTGKIGEISEIKEGTFEKGSYVKWKGPLGIVELKKAKTREDILIGSPGAPSSEYRSNKLPFLFKAINEDRKNRGLGDEIK